ncbi:MAG: ferritin family protein [Sedimentisphaerales bacterium]|nr:ferritin family protein [Sedimentisphaerales bacterium]
MATFQTVEELLDFAMQLEEQDHAFYRQCADKLTGQPAAAVFEELAQDEDCHFNTLEDIKQQRRKLDIPNKKTTRKLQHYMLEEDLARIPDDSENDADWIFRLAIAKEKMAFQLYTDLMNETSHKEMAQTLRGLAQQETEHKIILEQQYKIHCRQ